MSKYYMGHLSPSRILAIGKRNIQLQKVQSPTGSVSKIKAAGISKATVKRAKASVSTAIAKEMAVKIYGRTKLSLQELKDMLTGKESVSTPVDKRTKIGKVIAQIKEVARKAAVSKAYKNVCYLIRNWAQGNCILRNQLLERILGLLGGEVAKSIFTDLKEYALNLIKQGAAERISAARKLRGELEIADCRFMQHKLALLGC